MRSAKLVPPPCSLAWRTRIAGWPLARKGAGLAEGLEQAVGESLALALLVAGDVGGEPGHEGLELGAAKVAGSGWRSGAGEGGVRRFGGWTGSRSSG